MPYPSNIRRIIGVCLTKTEILRSFPLQLLLASGSLMDTAVKPAKAKAATKREKFRALAENRTNKALEAIGRIGNLSNRQIYEFDEAEVRKIVRALKDAVSTVESRFETPRGKSGGGFKL